MTVSIIIPVFQVASYIEACLNSVICQTYAGSMECLLVDDCGSDNSIAIAEKMIAAYDGPVRFKILRHGKNQGISTARNTGTDAATGDYVFYLDSDDELTCDCIEKLVKPVMNDTSIEIVMGNYTILSDGYPISAFERPVQMHQEDLKSTEAVRDYYFNKRGIYVYAWNKLIKKDFLVRHQLYFKDGLLWEDYLWTFFVVKYLNHLYTIPNVIYKYYKRPHSITTRANRKEKAHYMGLTYAEIANNFTIKESGREAKRFVKGFCYCYFENPKSYVLLQASRQYMKALVDNHYIKEQFLLRTTVFLSNFALGKSVLRLAAKAMERLIVHRKSNHINIL